MARVLLLLDQPFNGTTNRTATTAPAAAAAAATFLLFCAIALAGCASHGGRWRRFMSAGRGRPEPVISIHQVQPRVDGEGGANNGCVWQKSILMGEKCQLPDFSGIINYDPAGNLVVPGRPKYQMMQQRLP